MSDFFDVGDLVRFEATFTDMDGDAVDPTTVTFRMLDGAGVETVFVYGTDAEVVKSAVGTYHVDWPVAVHGVHRWRFESTGTGQAAQEGQFTGTGYQALTEPLSVTAAMRHLRVESDDPYLDDLPIYIKAARQHVEQHLNATIVNRMRTLVLDCFPNTITLPVGPVLGVTSIAYVDTDGATQMLTAANVIRSKDKVTPLFSESWPVTRRQLGAVTVTYTAGMMAGSPLTLADDDILAAIRLTLGDLWNTRESNIVGAPISINPTLDRLLATHRRDLGV
jgi:uncharacterized phiE125 gp8 family phage protein